MIQYFIAAYPEIAFPSFGIHDINLPFILYSQETNVYRQDDYNGSFIIYENPPDYWSAHDITDL